MSTFGFGPEARVRKRWQFAQVQRHGRKMITPHFIMFFLAHSETSDATSTQLGITVRKKIGSAPVRNRIKRKVREIFRRTLKHTEPKGAWVVVAQKGSEKLSFETMQNELLKASQKLVTLIQPIEASL